MSREDENKQAYIWDRPEDEIYGVQAYREGKWIFLWEGIASTVLSYKEGLYELSNVGTPARLVKLSRYLADGNVVATTVVKVKLQ